MDATCPGKVLLLGGYCILERPNSGLVIAVDARFHCEAAWEEIKINNQNFLVEIASPQWGDWTGSYKFDLENGLIPIDANSERNKYVEQTLAWSLFCAMSERSFPTGKYLKLLLLADNDFYSQQENLKKILVL